MYPRPFQGLFVVCQLGLYSYDEPVLYTKHEVSMFTHNEDMKGDEKCQNWSVAGGYASPRVIGNIAI